MKNLREVVDSFRDTSFYVDNSRAINYELNHLELHDMDEYLFSMFNKNIVSGSNDGNSYVSYLIGITDCKPIGQLITEGGSWPDIDVDFQQDRREEVRQHIIDRYGEDKVAFIGTFMFPKPKGLFKDVARIHDLDFTRSNQISKLIPDRPDLKTFDEALAESRDFKKLYDSDKEIKEIVDYARRLEGTIRAVSVHPCGVCISDQIPIDEIVPLFESKGQAVTQFDGPTLEKIGLIKYDILGLKNLTTIAKTIDIIKKTKGDIVDINNVPLDDKKTYDIISSNNSLGVFQIEGSQGLRDFASRCKPSTIHDLSAIISLFRPGPLGMGATDKYIARKSGYEVSTFEIPEFDYIFKDTYGLLIYQEQLIRLSEDMCGFTDIESDVLRKAVGKKDRDLLLQQKEKFVNGAVKNSGQDASRISRLFDEMEEFARYCFNASHSYAYAMITYQTAYLKAHYPSEYMASLISTETDPDSQSAYIEDARRNGINVVPPDINDSVSDFTVRWNGDILFGLNCIKGLGGKAVEKILDIKPFSSFSDFLIKSSHERGINKKVIESLINCGAFDVFGIKRSLMVANFEGFISDYKTELNSFIKSNGLEKDHFEKSIASKYINNESDYFSDDGTVLDYPILKILDYEKELLGIYVSADPFSVVSKAVDTEHFTIDELIKRGVPGYILCNMSSHKKILTKAKKEPMAFIDILDSSGNTKSITMFPKPYEKYGNLIVDGQFALAMVVPKKSERGIDLLCSSIENLTDKIFAISKATSSKNSLKSIEICISERINPVRFNTLMNTISPFITDENTGYSLALKYVIGDTIFKLKTWNCVSINMSMIRTLNKFHGIYLNKGS